MGHLIQLLPEEVANQIAAGEVVQRPASVVKELIENALDAGATEIWVHIQDAGRTSIQVIDNGSGIAEEDLPAAFTRHATSKLKTAEDLFALQTMGFRGEALASISAVTHATIKSRTAGQSTATELRCEGGHFGTPKKTAGPIGTTITAKNLFFNVPARRQFLKNDTLEFRHISEAFTAISLAQPMVRMHLKHNGQEVWILDTGNPRQRVAQILGKKANERLVPVGEVTDVVKTEGFVLRPEHARKTRGDQYLYVNKRPIKSGYLHRAIIEAFDGLIPAEHHPAYVLFLSVPTDRVDVNVHPAKSEVKFDDERAIYAIVRSAVKRALGIHQVAPTLDFENNLQQHVDLNGQTAPSAPVIHVDPNFNPFQNEGKFSALATASYRPSAQVNYDFFAAPKGQEVEQLAFDHAAEIPSGTGMNLEPGWCMPLPPHFAVAVLQNSLVAIHVKRARQHIYFNQVSDALHAGEPMMSQTWVFPEDLDLSVLRYWHEWVDILPRLGFQWADGAVGKQCLAGPQFLTSSQAIAWLEDLLTSKPDEEDDALTAFVMQWLEQWTQTAPLPTSPDLQSLMDALFSCANPWTNHAGKPIARILDGAALSTQFE